MKWISPALFALILISAFAIALPLVQPWPTAGLAPEQFFNFAEGWLWTLIALIFSVQAPRNPKPYQTLAFLASIAFFAFGVSDFIEFHTGVWYRPWSLFLFKGLCVLGFVGLFLKYVITKGQEKKKAEPEVFPESSPKL